MDSEAHDIVTRAKAIMVKQLPFFAHIALRLPFVENKSLNPPTMATDMRRVYYHPEFVKNHTLKEIIGVICHEVLHVAFLHGSRKGGRDHRLWNFACDYAINLIVKDNNLSLPGLALMDEKYRDWSAQEIYADLQKNMPPQLKLIIVPSSGGEGDGEGDGNGNPDGKMVVHGTTIEITDENGNPVGKETLDQLEAEIKIAVAAAADHAKQRGKLPAGVEGLIEAVGKPKINWQDYILRWLKGNKPDDYTWVKPNKIMMANFRVYAPSVKSMGSGVGLLSIDTSGSVSDEELVSYITEIMGLIEMCAPEKLIIIQHDATIQKVDIWEGEDFSKLHVKGRGGTNIRPSFKYAEELDEPIDWMICFTDMGIFDYPTEAPAFPVLWAATGPDNSPFGTYIPVKDAME